MPLLFASRLLRLAALCGVCCLAAGQAIAAPVVFTVTVDTSLIAGVSGFLDFAFAPGGDSQSAYVTVSGLSTDGVLTASPDVNGGVSGTLPGDVTIDNSTGFNDYFQAFDFGSIIEFLLVFNGPAVTTPNGVSTSGSTFTFGMFDSNATDPLLSVEPNGYTFTIDLDLAGGLTPTLFSPDGSSPSVASVDLYVPEPAPAILIPLAIAAFIAGQRRSRAAAVRQ